MYSGTNRALRETFPCHLVLPCCLGIRMGKNYRELNTVSLHRRHRVFNPKSRDCEVSSAYSQWTCTSTKPGKTVFRLRSITVSFSTTSTSCGSNVVRDVIKPETDETVMSWLGTSARVYGSKSFPAYIFTNVPSSRSFSFSFAPSV